MSDIYPKFIVIFYQNKNPIHLKVKAYLKRHKFLSFLYTYIRKRNSKLRIKIHYNKRYLK